VKRKSVITASRAPGFPSGSLNQRAGKEGVASPLITQVLFSYNLSFFKNTLISWTFKNPLTPLPVTKIELRPIGKRSLEQGYLGSGLINLSVPRHLIALITKERTGPHHSYMPSSPAEKQNK
jgi:hypothetical protein